MRMLEEILSDAAPHDCRPEFKKHLRDCEAFLIDNVGQYLYAETDQEVWHVKTDFPCLAPPFPKFWMEYSRPSKVVSCENGVQANELLPYRVGLFFHFMQQGEVVEDIFGPESAVIRENLEDCAKELNQRMTPEIERELDAMMAVGADFNNLEDLKLKELSAEAQLILGLLHQHATLEAMLPPEFRSKVEEFRCAKDVAWVGYCLPFMQLQRHGPIEGPLTKQVLAVKAQGEVLEVASLVNPRAVPRSAWRTGGAEDAKGLLSLWYPGLLAVSFCHCKNVTVKRDEAAPRLAKKRKERGGFSVSYKILEIMPMKKVLEKAGAQGQTGLKKALHICRGHFAEYQEHGLFGKYKGRFWIPQHIRGSVAPGVALKSYAVRPPK